MKLPFTLLAASLATSVSASSYTLCCCTKPILPKELPDGRYYRENPESKYSRQPLKQCDHTASQGIVDSMYGHFAFSKHFWEGVPGYPRFKGPDYIYATGINGDDNKIGQDEMTGWCRKYDAGRYCWTPSSGFYSNYKGDVQNPNGRP